MTVLDNWVDYHGCRGLPLIAVWGVVGQACECGRKSCERPGKHPCFTGWPTEVFDLTKLSRFTNFGVRTGHGLIVIDIDDPTAKLSDYPTTYTVQTAKGFHLYFTHDSRKSFRTMAPWRSGIDIRAEGGFVVAPPSRHITGVHYLPFNEAEIAPLPDELYHQIPAHTTRTPMERATDWVAAARDAPFYGDVAEMMIEEMACAHQGGRNDLLYRLACRLIELIDAELLVPTWIDALTGAAREAGLPDTEIQRTIASASGELAGSGARSTNHTRVLSSPKDGG